MDLPDMHPNTTTTTVWIYSSSISPAPAPAPARYPPQEQPPYGYAQPPSGYPLAPGPSAPPHHGSNSPALETSCIIMRAYRVSKARFWRGGVAKGSNSCGGRGGHGSSRVVVAWAPSSWPWDAPPWLRHGKFGSGKFNKWK
ncbi:hypothetical protein BHE74_00050590 [Ensete ventricosum]|nr:hypothetical protein BHE74_00050590 [Ensete ventricosum]